jgi:pyridoxamine 5'-phosphate oxidase
MDQFAAWFQEAAAAGVMHEPNAVALATSDAAGTPSIVFYTNKHSQKAADLLANPKAALNFFWEHLGRSVRASGSVEEVSEAESDAYFRSRPRSSQIGAWCSIQSSVIESRAVRHCCLSGLQG